MFANAKTIKPAAKKKATKEIVSIDGLEQLAAIDTVMKSLEALKETLAADVKSQMAVHFVKTGCERKARPANFQGEEGLATASCELRARSSRSALSPSEVELLSQNDVPTETVEDVAETFVLNPAYKDDQNLLATVQGALEGVDGIPADLFLRQEGVSRTVVSEGAIDAIFKLDPDVANTLLSIVTTLAIKPKLAADLDKAFEIVNEVMGG